jgi:chaperonin GroEL (HSP60 family)
MRVEMEDAYVLINEKKLYSLNELLPLLEAVVQSGKPLLIMREIRKLSDTDIASIANNLRIPRSELETLAAHGQGAKELARLLNELGIEEAAVIRKEPGIICDMRMICALCVAKLRCGRELDDGTAKTR